MAFIPAAVTLIGAGLQATSSILSANAKSDAAEKDAMLKNQQADELMSRTDVVAADIAREGYKVKGAQVNALGQSGLSGSSVLLSSMEETDAAVARQTANMQRDAAFRADQLRKGAQVSSDLASDEYTAGVIGAGGSILGAAYKFGDANGWWTPNSGITNLGAAPDINGGGGSGMMERPYRTPSMRR